MKTYSLDGVVLDYARHPLPDVVVTIASGTGRAPDIAAITDDQGEFSFFDVEPGQYRLKAVYGHFVAFETARVYNDSAFVEIIIK